MKTRYFFDYLVPTKGPMLSKRQSSRMFETVTEARKDAQKRHSQGKILQASIMSREGTFGTIRQVAAVDTHGRYRTKYL